MRTGIQLKWIVVAALATWLVTPTAQAQDKDDPFKGRLFAPNVIIENRAELDLSREQFTAIRAAVVEVQGNIAGHEWDMQQAYLRLIEALDERPIDEDAVLEHAMTAMRAENEVKLKQMAMLLRLRSLLTDEQVATLVEKQGP